MTKANWSYTGPALPLAEANELLADGPNGPNNVRMAASGCSPEPTFFQEINAFGYAQSTSAAISQYVTPASAVTAGLSWYPTNYPITYYVNPSIVDANTATTRTLDPGSIDGLVYAQVPSVRSSRCGHVPAADMVASPPMPYGPLVQWHQRTTVCG